jgi:F-type H+-transporting ATPase subunit b
MHLDGWTLGLQSVNFAILVWLLHRFLYKPVLAMIDARKAEIQRGYDEAKTAADKAATLLAATEAERAGMAAERDAAMAAATAQAHDLAEARHAQAEREAQSVLAAGRRALATERDSVLDEARRLALDLGAAFAGRLLSELPAETLAEAWIARIERHLGGLNETERESLLRQLGEGKAVTVVTAAPLPKAAAEMWSRRLRACLGGHCAMRFETDPALIAGADLHFPSAVLRLSWQSALAAAQAELGSSGRPG